MFNSVLLAGKQDITLQITSNQNVEYVVEAQVVAALGRATVANDVVVLDIASGVEMRPNLSSEYAINASGLHDDATLKIVTAASVVISGRGGDGGAGGDGYQSEFDAGTPGTVGDNGGDAINMGCDTEASGSGTITKGYGGGGGAGGFSDTSFGDGGGGGGGGAPYGDGGAGGDGDSNVGNVGSASADISNAGAGGVAVGFGKAGGVGGDSGGAQAAGGNSTFAGGGAGSDGIAVNQNGFTWSASGVTVTGDVT